MGFNSGFKGLKKLEIYYQDVIKHSNIKFYKKKICALAAEFYVVRQAGVTKRMVAFRCFAKAPKKVNSPPTHAHARRPHTHTHTSPKTAPNITKQYNPQTTQSNFLLLSVTAASCGFSSINGLWGIRGYLETPLQRGIRHSDFLFPYTFLPSFT